jgi:hypothetical protein
MNPNYRTAILQPLKKNKPPKKAYGFLFGGLSLFQCFDRLMQNPQIILGAFTIRRHI